MVAGEGIAPPTRAYETLEILFLHPAIEINLYGELGENQTVSVQAG